MTRALIFTACLLAWLGVGLYLTGPTPEDIERCAALGQSVEYCEFALRQ